MTHYRCIRCGTEGEDKETLNHGIGLTIGRPCAGGPDAPLEVTGKTPKTETAATETTAEIPKSKGRLKKSH